MPPVRRKLNRPRNYNNGYNNKENEESSVRRVYDSYCPYCSTDICWQSIGRLIRCPNLTLCGRLLPIDDNCCPNCSHYTRTSDNYCRVCRTNLRYVVMAGNESKLFDSPTASTSSTTIRIVPCEVRLQEMTGENIEAVLNQVKEEEFALKLESDDCGVESDDNDIKPVSHEAIIPDELDYSTTRRVKMLRRRGKESLPLKNIKRKRLGTVSKRTDCEECGKIFKTTGQLKVHLRIHDTIHQCRYCKNIFSGKRQLRDHLNLEHTTEKSEPCPHCDKLFFSESDVKKHISTHLDKNPMTCGLCNTVFPSEMALKAHQLTHVSTEAKLPLFVCPIDTCHKRYMSLQLLQSHVRYIHERRNAFVCHYVGCDKSFGTESYLNAHIVSHESTGSHLCDLCGKNYKHKKDLTIHKQRIHTAGKVEELKPYACDVCSRRYYRADHLRMHRVKSGHYVGGEEPQIPEPVVDPMTYAEEYKCTVCNKDFVSDIALKTHLLTHENESKVQFEYSCTECNRKYTSMKALDYHTKYMHRLKGTFSCPSCPKTFGRMSSYKRHLLVHSNTKHICGHCHKRYRIKGDLFQHIRREHVIGDDCYKYECEVCQKRFYRGDMLRIHKIKSGHVGPKKLDNDQEVEETTDQIQEEVAVYVVETSDNSQEAVVELNVEKDGVQEEFEGLIQNDVIQPNIDSHEEIIVTEEPVLRTLNSVPLELVEITGEDEQGAIARVVMVDENGIEQDIETEVICAVDHHDEDDEHLDSEFKFFNYSIELG